MKPLRQIFGVMLLILLAVVGAFNVRMGYLINQPVPTVGPSAQIDSKDQYYFAYGTNMPTRYLYNIRGILPAQSQSGMIENYEIRFLAPGLNSLEPAFAYLLKAEGKKAYGVLHRLSKPDLAKVKESEGELYGWATLPVVLGDGQIVAAQTLVRNSPGDAGKPSRRYLEILTEGAVEHGLPSEYIAKLRDMPSAYFPVASELMGNVLQAVVMKRSAEAHQ